MRELQIITKRPDNMYFMEYQRLRRESNDKIKSYLRGTILWDTPQKGQFKGSTKELIRQS